MRFICVFIGLLSVSAIAQNSSSSLNKNCSQDGFACGACENDMQGELNDILNGITEDNLETEHWGNLKDEMDNQASNIQFKNPMPKYEDVLDDIVGLMRKNTPGGNLNYVVIGESESLQQTSVKDGKMNPRIMLKSPNSELMVTFATDPDLPGYNSIEIMRWNGKEGRYEFQELNFGDQGEPPHIDLSGKKCAECHKSPSMRPNWDTYRAWAGVVPSRDDMLEMEFNGDKIDKSKPMQPDARAYLGFLDQIAQAKDSPNNPRSKRLAMLDIPFDEEVQMSEYLEDFKDKNGREPNEKEKVELIKQRVEKDGFYRVRHHPDKLSDTDMPVNFDSKTSDAAGPSQFAFDQMLAQNMCRITNDLRKHPKFDEFKYGLTSLIKCGNSGTFNRVKNFLPESYLDKIKDFHVNNQGSTMTEIDPETKNNLEDKSPDEIFKLLNTDTDKSHGRANDFKFDRHGKFLRSYLTEIENMSEEDAQKDATFFANEVSTPYQDDPIQFHAIGDPGGVSGVAEDKTTMLASIRFLLEPMGVKVEHWSLVNGKDTAYNSYSFSDQFTLFQTQPIFDEISKEVEKEMVESGELESMGSWSNKNAVCNELNNRSIASLDDKANVITPNETIAGYLSEVCNKRDKLLENSVDNEIVDFANELTQSSLRQDARDMMKKCLTCHTPGSYYPELKGVKEFVENDDDSVLVEFLNSEKMNQKYVEIFQDKLGVHQPTMIGSAMPPSDWEDNKEFAEKYELDPLNIQNERRKLLGIYVKALSEVSVDKNELDNICNTISGSSVEVIDGSQQSTPSNSPSSAIKN